MAARFNDSTVLYASNRITYNGVLLAQGSITQAGQSINKVNTRPNTFMADILPLFKQHARIDWPDDDRLCQLYLKAAISRIEQWCEMPIAPASYDWDAKALIAGHTIVELPFRNTIAAGDVFNFELLIGRKFVKTPTTWPMHLEVGFTSGDDCPDDILLSIFEMALGLYEMRSNPEMASMYAADIMNGNLSRYYVPRC